MYLALSVRLFVGLSQFSTSSVEYFPRWRKSKRRRTRERRRRSRKRRMRKRRNRRRKGRKRRRKGRKRRRKIRNRKKKRRKRRRKRAKMRRTRLRRKRNRKGKIYFVKTFAPRPFLLTFVVCYPSACTIISIKNQRNSQCHEYILAPHFKKGTDHQVSS